MKNKNLITFSIITTLSCISFLAQVEEVGVSANTNSALDHRSENRFFRRLIIEGSLSNAGQTGSDASQYSQANAYGAGILLDLIGSQKLVLETGVIYRRFGTNYNYGFGDYSFTANYISVPIDAKYYFSGQEESSFFIKAGILGSTLISKNTFFATPSRQVGARSWETAFLGGLGAKINLTKTTDFVLEGDYSRSLNSLLYDVEIYRSEFSGVLGLAINI